MFNREYQRRAARQVLERLGIDVVQDNSGFYRPERRPWPGTRPATLSRKNRPQGLQLELFADNGVQEFTGCEILHTPVKNSPAMSADRPLLDLFPEAYQ